MRLKKLQRQVLGAMADPRDPLLKVSEQHPTAKSIARSVTNLYNLPWHPYMDVERALNQLVALGLVDREVRVVNVGCIPVALWTLTEFGKCQAAGHEVRLLDGSDPANFTVCMTCRRPEGLTHVEEERDTLAEETAKSHQPGQE